jgi:RHS repeat-associated protein
VASASYDAANRQRAWSGLTLTYDANGNLTTDSTTTYAWDARDRLSALSGSSTSAVFRYDPLGRRRHKTIGATETQFYYDGLNPVQVLSGTGGVTNILTGLGIDEFFVSTEAADQRTVLTDALSSTIAELDPTAALLAEYTYGPFGQTSATGAPRTPFQYTGRENDGAGLYYYRARYYHSTLQRFISEDPIGLRAGDTNFYGYVGNSPVNFADPFGLDKEKKCPSVPPVPPGVNIDANILLAELMSGGPPGLELWWWVGMVSPSGQWDYKVQGPALVYEDFGNFNYGATGAALGLPQGVIFRGAGAAQWWWGPYRPQWGKPWGGPPYGDQPQDQPVIKAGIEYYRCTR